MDKTLEELLEQIAKLICNNSLVKPNMSDAAFCYSVLIFTNGMYDKMADYFKEEQEANLRIQATNLGNELDALIRKYTGLDAGLLLDEYTNEPPCHAAGLTTETLSHEDL